MTYSVIGFVVNDPTTRTLRVSGEPRHKKVTSVFVVLLQLFDHWRA
jgi:hypothetical protein